MSPAQLPPHYPLTTDRRTTPDRRHGDDRRSPALDLPMPKRPLGVAWRTDPTERLLVDVIGALSQLHTVCLEMDAEKKLPGFNERSYQRAMARAARLLHDIRKVGT